MGHIISKIHQSVFELAHLHLPTVDDMTIFDSEPLDETTGEGWRVQSGVLQLQAHSVPPLQVVRAKHKEPALATLRDLKPAQDKVGRKPWRIVNYIITYILLMHFLFTAKNV